MGATLNRDAAAAVAAAAGRGRPSLHLLPVDEARAHYELENSGSAPTPAMHSVHEVEIVPGVPGRLYRPGASALPVVLFFHGGGWVIGSVDTHDRMCRELAARSGCAVLSVGYRRAPEHAFPAAVDDAHTALQWVRAHGVDLGLDPGRLAVAGDSAGGNIATALALRARGTAPAVRLQVLFYPVTTTDLDVGTDPAYDHLGLSREELQWHQEQYLPAVADRRLPESSPLDCARLAGAPTAVIIVAECDSIAPQGLRYAEALRSAGVAVTVHVHPGTIHGFAQRPEAFEDAGTALAQAGDALRGALVDVGGGGQP